MVSLLKKKPDSSNQLELPNQAKSNARSSQSKVSAGTVTRRVYSLSLEEGKRIGIRELSYVSVKQPASQSKAAAARPAWVPPGISAGCWWETLPCYWKVDNYVMQELEIDAGKLIYNPLADYSLEFIRYYRRDLFENIFKLFAIWCKKLYNEGQIARLKRSISINRVKLTDVMEHFSDRSPLVPTLKTATMAGDILPEIEHYLGLLKIRAFMHRESLDNVR